MTANLLHASLTRMQHTRDYVEAGKALQSDATNWSYPMSGEQLATRCRELFGASGFSVAQLDKALGGARKPAEARRLRRLALSHQLSAMVQAGRLRRVAQVYASGATGTAFQLAEHGTARHDAPA